MNDRVHRALDGDLPPDQLNPRDLASYQEYHRAISQALRGLEGLPPVDVTPAVLRRIAGRPGRRGVLARTARWAWSPRQVSFSLRPAWALAAALLLVVGGTFAIPGRGPGGSPAPAVVAPQVARVIVQFRLGDATAHRVSLVGDFTGWNSGIELRQVAPGIWSYELPLEPGVYNYGFLVDGAIWRPDPLAPQVTDGFGGTNSRLTVLAPEVAS